jgi:sporulation protein YqfC
VAVFPAIEWLDEAGSLPRLMLSGGRYAVVENHLGILEFTPERVRLMTKCGVLELEGEALELSQVRKSALTVRGRICQIRLPEGGGEDA